MDWLTHMRGSYAVTAAVCVCVSERERERDWRCGMGTSGRAAVCAKAHVLNVFKTR